MSSRAPPAIHIVKGHQGREQALAEIFRVLKPGGTALMADIAHTAAYERYFAAQPGTPVERRGLGLALPVRRTPRADPPGDGAARSLHGKDADTDGT